MVDLADDRVLSEEEIEALREVSAEAKQAQYGKLEPALYERLQTLEDEDTLQVAVFVKAPAGKSMSELEQQAFALVAEKYPEAKAALARSGKPMDVADQELSWQIEQEYHAYVRAEIRAYVQPLVTELEQQGFAVNTSKGHPSFTVSLPKRVILALNEHSDVGLIRIYFTGEEEPDTDDEPLLLDACQSKEALAFETIEQRLWGGTDKGYYEAREPGLIVITRPEEVVGLSEWVTNEARIHLQTLDYETYFALVIFQGWKPGMGYSVQVNCMTRQDDTINVYVQFREPASGSVVAAAVTSPYHLVQVQKSGIWEQDITFNLIADETNIVSVSHFIP